MICAGVLPVDKLDVELPGEDDERAAHHLTRMLSLLFLKPFVP